MRPINAHIKLSPEIHDLLRKLAFDTRKSMSKHIRQAIEEYLLKTV